MVSWEMQRRLQEAEREERREQARLEAEAEAERDRIQGELLRFAAVHGCSPAEAALQQAAVAERQAEAEERRRQDEAQERHEQYIIGLLQSGRQARTVAEILAAAAGVL